MKFVCFLHVDIGLFQSPLQSKSELEYCRDDICVSQKPETSILEAQVLSSQSKWGFE